MAFLTIVPTSAFTFCLPWHLRYLQSGILHSGSCCFCNRAVAVPESAYGKSVGCIYCGFDSGDVEPIDKPLEMER